MSERAPAHHGDGGLRGHGDQRDRLAEDTRLRVADACRAIIDRLEKGEKVWAPYYTLHKILAGLIDAHALCGNAQALDMLVAMADWVRVRNDELDHDDQQQMLKTEHGGMKDVLANLYAATGKETYLKLAERFTHHAVTDPFLQGKPLVNICQPAASTQLPGWCSGLSLTKKNWACCIFPIKIQGKM